MNNRPILLCEPQCHGFEHARFNAAFMLTLLEAFPNADLVFVGESEHLRWDRESLEESGRNQLAGVTWQPCLIPPRHRGGWRRLGNERELLSHVYHLAEQNKASHVIFCSVTTAGLMMLRRFLSANPRPMPTWMVFHSLLKEVQKGLPLHRLRCEIPLRPQLRGKWPEKLRGIVLGPSVLRELLLLVPQAKGRFDAIDLPYIWPEIQVQENCGAVVFGYFGVRMVGLRQFYDLARVTQSRNPDARFTHVGFLHDSKCRPAPGVTVEGLTTTPLSPQEFARRAQSVTYAVWLSAYDDFRLLASATFLDALAYGKPGIYMRTPYVEYYFERLGNIGYLCDTLKEVEEKMVEILTNFPAETYREQQKNILKGRRIFSPDAIAPHLRDLLEP